MIQMWIKAAIVAGSVIIGLGSVYLLKMPADNAVEETCEKVIKDATDGTLDIDLTPGSKEEVKK